MEVSSMRIKRAGTSRLCKETLRGACSLATCRTRLCVARATRERLQTAFTDPLATKERSTMLYTLPISAKLDEPVEN